MITRRDGIATCFDLWDATERKFTLSHFAACSLASLNLADARQSELRLDRRTAGEMASLLDHFARHNQFPHSFPQPDYMI